MLSINNTFIKDFLTSLKAFFDHAVAKNMVKYDSLLKPGTILGQYSPVSAITATSER